MKGKFSINNSQRNLNSTFLLNISEAISPTKPTQHTNFFTLKNYVGMNSSLHLRIRRSKGSPLVHSKKYKI